MLLLDIRTDIDLWQWRGCTHFFLRFPLLIDKDGFVAHRHPLMDENSLIDNQPLLKLILLLLALQSRQQYTFGIVQTFLHFSQINTRILFLLPQQFRMYFTVLFGRTGTIFVHEVELG